MTPDPEPGCTCYLDGHALLCSLPEHAELWKKYAEMMRQHRETRG